MTLCTYVDSSSSSDISVMFDTLISNINILRQLKKEPSYKRKLATQLDVSKKTIYRRTNELQNFGLIDHSNEGYYLTKLGYYHLELYEDFETYSNSIHKVLDSVTDAPMDSLPSYQFFRGAKIYSAKSYDPHRPIDRLQSLVAQTDKIRGFYQLLLPI